MSNPPLRHADNNDGIIGGKYLCGAEKKSWPKKYLDSDRYIHEVKACPKCKELDPSIKGLDEYQKEWYGDVWDDWDKWVLISYWHRRANPATSGSKHAKNWKKVLESIENKGSKGEYQWIDWHKPESKSYREAVKKGIPRGFQGVWDDATHDVEDDSPQLQDVDDARYMVKCLRSGQLYLSDYIKMRKMKS